jgi:hypothetical protein
MHAVTRSGERLEIFLTISEIKTDAYRFFCGFIKYLDGLPLDESMLELSSSPSLLNRSAVDAMRAGVNAHRSLRYSPQRRFPINNNNNADDDDHDHFARSPPLHVAATQLVRDMHTSQTMTEEQMALAVCVSDTDDDDDDNNNDNSNRQIQSRSNINSDDDELEQCTVVSDEGGGHDADDEIDEAMVGRHSLETTPSSFSVNNLDTNSDLNNDTNDNDNNNNNNNVDDNNNMDEDDDETDDDDDDESTSDDDDRLLLERLRSAPSVAIPPLYDFSAAHDSICAELDERLASPLARSPESIESPRLASSFVRAQIALSLSSKSLRLSGTFDALGPSSPPSAAAAATSTAAANNNNNNNNSKTASSLPGSRRSSPRKALCRSDGASLFESPPRQSVVGISASRRRRGSSSAVTFCVWKLCFNTSHLFFVS